MKPSFSCKLLAVFIMLMGLFFDSLKSQEVKDIDGNVYTVVKIGNQEWLGQNLKTTRYSNGVKIGTSKNADSDITIEKNPKYQWAYHGDYACVNIYGRLYTWYAVVDSQNVCPTGWHVPSQDEWLELINYLGAYWAGLLLKERYSEHWTFGYGFYYKFPYPSYATVRTDNGGSRVVEVPYTNFNAIGCGHRLSTGDFYAKNFFGFWWTSTEVSDSKASYFSMNGFSSEVEKTDGYKKDGESVRCIRDRDSTAAR